MTSNHNCIHLFVSMLHLNHPRFFFKFESGHRTSFNAMLIVYGARNRYATKHLDLNSLFVIQSKLMCCVWVNNTHTYTHAYIFSHITTAWTNQISATYPSCSMDRKKFMCCIAGAIRYCQSNFHPFSSHYSLFHAVLLAFIFQGCSIL